MLEKDIQKGILQYLQVKRVFHWRNNSGAYKTSHGSFIRFGEPGSPDIFVIRGGMIYGLEVKNEKGKLSDLQEEWSKGFMKHGGLYHVVRNLDDVIALFG